MSITILAGNAILIEAGLSFLGLGDAGSPSWGSMLRDAQPIMREAPWALGFPAVAVVLAVLSFNLLGDGLLDFLSPWARSGREHRRSRNRIGGDLRLPRMTDPTPGVAVEPAEARSQRPIG